MNIILQCEKSSFSVGCFVNLANSMITGEVNIIADLGTKFIKIATLWTGQSSFRIFCSQEISSDRGNVKILVAHKFRR